MEDPVRDTLGSMVSEEQTISKEQIQELLQNAEKRLRQAASKMLTHSPNPQERGGTQVSWSLNLDHSTTLKPYVSSNGDIARADASRLIPTNERPLRNQIRRVEDPVTLAKEQIKAKKATMGPDWFNLPRTQLTPELKKDLELLRLRNVLDPKRHYKKENGKPKVPEFSQVGTIIEGPTEYFSARLQRKDRKSTLVEDVLAQEAITGRFKSKYNDVQVTKTSGKRAHYKAIVAKRRRSKVY